ncbi:hypothetical protein [Methanocella conradii]|uniref:hypothetical protein n=1 Tax=Methanocella conradii TaxID=1175444 RepID=UPI00157C5524|nr:hypothetical protein [Methanocella conradii]
MSFIDLGKRGDELVDEIGVDIDTKNPLINLMVQVNASNLGVVHSYETRKGWHYRVKLKREITLKDAFKLRQYLGDDMYRMLIDAMRIRMGLTIYDVLFTAKKQLK